MRPKLLRGFSLIELLIVVTIISILAAIAIPNFLQTQIRTKLVRAKSDMRALVISLEAYRVDSNKYPPAIEIANRDQFIMTGTGPVYEGLLPPAIMSPVAYISELPRDPFPPLADGLGESKENSFHYLDRRSAEARGEMTLFDDYHTACLGKPNMNSEFWLFTVGPDLEHDRDLTPGTKLSACLYDPTNGTVSNGDLYYFQATGLQ